MATAKQKAASAKRRAAAKKKKTEELAGAALETAPVETPTVEDIPVSEPEEQEALEVKTVVASSDDTVNLDVPGDSFPLDGGEEEFDEDSDMLVVIEEGNFVYLSKQRAVGEELLLVSEGHFNPAKMSWVNRSMRKIRSKSRFKKRAAKGTFRDAMQSLA